MLRSRWQRLLMRVRCGGRRRTVAAIAGFLVCGIGACESATHPKLLSFERLDLPVGGTPSPQLIGGDGPLRLLATFRTPCEPYTASATFQFTGSSLRLVVSGGKLPYRVDS